MAIYNHVHETKIHCTICCTKHHTILPLIVCYIPHTTFSTGLLQSKTCVLACLSSLAVAFKVLLHVLKTRVPLRILFWVNMRHPPFHGPAFHKTLQTVAILCCCPLRSQYERCSTGEHSYREGWRGENNSLTAFLPQLPSLTQSKKHGNQRLMKHLHGSQACQPLLMNVCNHVTYWDPRIPNQQGDP